MRTLTYIFILILALVLLTSVSNAQVVAKTDDIFITLHVHSGAADSAHILGTTTSGIGKPLAETFYLNNKPHECLPDSIRIDGQAATDTVIGKLYFKARYDAGRGTWTRDSVYALTAGGRFTYSVAYTKWLGYRQYDVVWAGTSGTGTTATNTLAIRVTRFYSFK